MVFSSAAWTSVFFQLVVFFHVVPELSSCFSELKTKDPEWTKMNLQIWDVRNLLLLMSQWET